MWRLQAHLGHKINGNKIHDDEKTTRSNVIKTDKVLRQGPYTYEGRPPAQIPTVRPFRIRQKMNKPSLPANHAKTTSRKRENNFVVFANVQQANCNCPSAYK